MSEDAQSSGEKACVVAIDVDKRQAYIFETDKLREMLGASRIIDGTRDKAKEYFKDDGLHIFSPVSGEIRVWAPAADREKLLKATWQLREWLNERGVEHSVAYCEADEADFRNDADGRSPDPTLSEVHKTLGRRVTSIKAAKPGPDARPRCSLFAACQIHALDPANVWQPQRKTDEDEPRRELVGFRAAWKLDAWEKERKRLYDTWLKQPVLKRLQPVLKRLAELRPEIHATVSKPPGMTLGDLSDLLDRPGEAGDQYIAFICCDGDSMGKVLTKLSWNHPEWKKNKPAEKREPWERNHDFSVALDDAIRDAARAGILATLDTETFREYLSKRFSERARKAQKENKQVELELPVLPQLCGGEDMWIVAHRGVALQLAIAFGREYEELARCPHHHEGIIEIARTLAPVDDKLTLSFGIAFAKAGFPVHAMVDAAEKLLKSAKALRKDNLKEKGRPAPKEGCIDWHWIESSLTEDVEDARARWRYRDDDRQVLHLTTRPWSISETQAFIDATHRLARLPRRKREQIETIVRLGRELSLLAWESWWKSLRPEERADFEGVNTALPDAFRLCHPSTDPWRNLGTPEQPRWVTPLLDLLALQHVLGIEGKQLSRPATSTAGVRQEAAHAAS